jgi:diacylglycerol kinase (ATP)
MPARRTTAAPGRDAGAPLRPRRRASFLAAFAFAAAGLADAALRERNLRVHLALGVLASCAAAVLPLSGAERAVVLLCVGVVVAAETLNSAVEVLADAIFPGEDARARFAKDAAAGAVLALAAASLAVGWLVVAPLADALAAGATRLLLPASGALVAALAAALLPSGIRGRAARLLLVAAAGAGLGAVVPSSRSHAAVLAAALLVAIGAGAAARAAAGKGPPRHGP